jgi:hypothetical protein
MSSGEPTFKKRLSHLFSPEDIHVSLLAWFALPNVSGGVGQIDISPLMVDWQGNLSKYFPHFFPPTPFYLQVSSNNNSPQAVVHHDVFSATTLLLLSASASTMDDNKGTTWDWTMTIKNI